MYHRRSVPNPARIDRDDEKRMLPCRFFLAGFCQKGPRCKFFHPNLHLREPYVKVPELPANFSTLQENARARNDIPSLLDIPGPKSRRNVNRRSEMMMRPSVSISPRRRGIGRRTEELRNGHGRNMPSPARGFGDREFHAAMLMDEYDEEDEESSGSNSPERKSLQNTIFNHIDWNEFLVPGVKPPLPTHVPEEGITLSPIKGRGFGFPLTERPRAGAGAGRPQSKKFMLEDFPPEGLQISKGMEDPGEESEHELGDVDLKRKLSAKEEFQRKVKQMAAMNDLSGGGKKESAPVPHGRSLDSFFSTFKFNGYHMTADNPSNAAVASTSSVPELGSDNKSPMNVSNDKNENEEEMKSPDANEEKDKSVNSNESEEM